VKDRVKEIGTVKYLTPENFGSWFWDTRARLQGLREAPKVKLCFYFSRKSYASPEKEN
jgi:hypothetical protein